MNYSELQKHVQTSVVTSTMEHLGCFFLRFGPRTSPRELRRKATAPGLGQFCSTALLRWGDKVATENRGRASGHDGKMVHSWQKWSIFMGKSPFTLWVNLQLWPWLLVITGCKWDYTFYKWGYKYL